MKLSYKRADRLGEFIQTEVSDIILRKIKDPRIRLVTITGVDVSDDLRMARVYFSVMGDEKQCQKAMDGLKSATGFIKKSLGPRLDLRYVPDIEFHYDRSLEYGERIDKLLREIKEEHGNS
ncbi:MAG: 30S ribosome-binding factor RbfA [Thermodesulfobacteriota bacterium]